MAWFCLSSDKKACSLKVAAVYNVQLFKINQNTGLVLLSGNQKTKSYKQRQQVNYHPDTLIHWAF